MNVCVFCGSSTGQNPVFAAVATALGETLVQHRLDLVYGGGNIGLMGVVADAVMAGGGKVTGIIPEFLMNREVGHTGISNLEVVPSMHVRKQRMADLADAFIALPGGWGTLEELFEILTWKQLGLITQPVIMLNAAGFFDPLLAQMRVMEKQGFLKPAYLQMLHVVAEPHQTITHIIP